MVARTALAACLCLIAGCTGTTPATPDPTPATTPTPFITAAPTPSITAPPTPTMAPTDDRYAGSGWTASALDLGPVGATFVFECPPNGSARVVWGSDVYTADSSVCTAAVHAGAISLASGGDVTIEMWEGQARYEGSARNGVTTLSYPAYDSSFVVVGAPQPTPSPSGSPAAGEGFGPFEALFTDDFGDPSSGWGTATLESGNIDYDGLSSLVIEVTETNQGLRTTRQVGSTWNVLRVEATMRPSGAGVFGLLCALSINEMVGAVISTSGGVLFVRLSAGNLSVLSRDDDAGLLVLPGLPTLLAVECTGTSTGSTRLRIEVDGELVGTYDGGMEGPAAFSSVGVYGEATEDQFQVAVDEVSVGGGTGDNLPPPLPSGSPSAVADLLTHVPAAIRSSCEETPPSAFDQGSLVAVACAIRQSGAGAEIIEYVQFDSTDSMNAAYQSRVQFYGADATGSSCQQGPSEIPYTINNAPAGRLLCAPQTAGIRFDWTDERLNILSTATDFDSSYADLYQEWLGAGPTR